MGEMEWEGEGFRWRESRRGNDREKGTIGRNRDREGERDKEGEDVDHTMGGSLGAKGKRAQGGRQAVRK